MTTVGFLAMKLARGSAASSMTVTAARTATTMIGRCSVMPTAVRMESIEKTRSRMMIWKIAAPALEMTTSFLSSTSWLGVGSTVWWISLVAFQIRNRPPAIRIRSFHENAFPNTVKTGWINPTSQAMIDSSASRITRARPMPMRRTRVRCSGGSLFDRIEMKIRLSIPSTTSITTRVTSAAQAAGSVRRGAMESNMRVPDQLCRLLTQDGPVRP